MSLPTNLREVADLTIAIPSHVLFQQLDGEAVLLDVQTGGYFGLNGVGTYIWEKFTEGASVQSAISAVCDHYEVDAERAASDIQAFLSVLHQQGLIVVNEQAH